MAIDQNFGPFQPSSSSTAGDPSAADEAAVDQRSTRKVKLLCSFGGKIAPRPSDGALRYAGGQTRIISVWRDTTLPELCRKMADVYGGPIAIRYQLPDEDLDALVSVSSAEDLENMMEEYDKLAEASGDGSAKLRVFLFSQAEVASVLTDNFSAGPALIDPYDSGQKYIEAEADIKACEIRLKGITESASCTQNSDAGFDGFNNEGTSAVLPPTTAGASVSFDPSTFSFVETATPVPLQVSQSLPANSTGLGQTMLSTHSLNPLHVAPYASQALVETHQVHYVPPLSLNMASESRMVNVVSVPQHTYLPPIPIPPASMPSQVGSVKPAQGKRDPFSEEDQFGGRFVQPVSDPNFKVFQQSLSQIPPLQPSHLPPPSVEPYELHLFPPPIKGPGLRFEDCLMCQKALPHVHSDRRIKEQGNVSGVPAPNTRPILLSHHSEDISRLNGQHRVVSAAMMDKLVEPKVEHTVNPGQYGMYGVKKVPDLVLDRAKIFVPTAEEIDHSKLRQPLSAVDFSGDTKAPYGVFLSPHSHLEGSFQPLQKQALHGDNFYAPKVLHPTNGASLSPSQTRLDDSSQKQNAVPTECADYIKVLHPSATMGLSSTGQTSYGVSIRPPQPQPHHDGFLQQQQLPTVTVPTLFSFKQVVIGKQGSNDSSSINNISYNALEPLSHAQDYGKQVDGIMEALNANTCDILRSSDQLKPQTVVPNVGAPKDMKPESLPVVGDNHTIRPQNVANALHLSNAIISSAASPEGIYIKPVNPVVLNTDISREIKPESSSLIGEDNGTVRPHHGGSKLSSSNAFVNTGLLPMENSMRPINPLLSTTMNLHTFEIANSSQVSTMTGSSVPYTQNLEKGANTLPSNRQIPGMPPHITDPSYTNIIAEGTSRVWKDEVSPVQDFLDDTAASRRGNVPYPLYSSIGLGHGEQFHETFASSSLLGKEGPQEILGRMNTYLPRAANFASKKSTVSGDASSENHLPKAKDPDIAVLLEEGSLQPPVDWLIKGSRPDPVIAAKDSGTDYIQQDLRDLAEQVGESVLQSPMPSTSVPSFSRSKELSPPFLSGSGLSEDNSNSQSAAVLGDKRIEDIKVRQLDMLHMGLPISNNIGRLQIIKNSDLEELRELGSGTFGTVYHGKWRGSDVAIKRINDRCFAGKPSEQEKMRADFWNEASKLADLHHPNVVAFYGVALDCLGGSFATVTEYMVNGSLRNALQRNDKPLDRWKRILIAMDIAFGMEYLHGKNVVHFDLKSDNLLVNFRDPQRPICKVGDLGLSKVKCQTLISGGVRGTLPWMAPELLNGCSNLVSDKVDVFSFGIVMWELLTGDEPYSDLHYGAIIGGIVSNTLRPVVPNSCDPEWRALMEQCWSAESSERPNFKEITNRLRSMAASLPPKGQAQK